ncbi:xylose ABC transporter ATP-binding protein [Neobacillus sp. KR4-4]|uniref:xylose ABC transporter ATP-binding protein n=1 Tax=Neobacillus sp. KR4-4 TaxID=3344872 RepID=UPI0035CA6901
MSDYILEMRQITKEFPGVKALSDINIKVKRGEIHALCGENGAGKSTLIKTLCGIYPYGTYSGEIVFNGQVQQFQEIRDAEEKGIVCIHQELALVQELSVQENIFLGNEPNNLGVINWDDMYNKTVQLLEQLELRVDPEEKVGNLGVGQQQLIEIAKALSKNAKLLILDEPTSALTEKESEILIGIIKKLKKQGVTSIYISHKLDEVMSLADSISAIRDGQYIGTEIAEKIDKNKLIYMMVGRVLDKLFPRVEHSRGELAFEIRNFTVYDPSKINKKIIDNVTFQAYRGEIVGIAGLMGAGRTEFVSSIFGAFPGKVEGEIYLEGKKVTINNPFDAIKNGIALVSEDRKGSGLVLDMDIKQNISMASLDAVSKLIINENKEVTISNKFVSMLNIKTSGVETIVNNLSGGNQQKVVIGKWLMTEPKVLILDEPTRGIDIGAKYEIYKIMNDLVDKGVIVVMVSSELEEVLGMSDRVYVMTEGNFSAELSIEEASQEKIIYYATGGK